MNQMEHNVKIKDYKRYQESPYVQTLYALNSPQNYPNKTEQYRMVDRFQQIHWKSEKRPMNLPPERDQLRYLRREGYGVVSNEEEERRDEHWHRAEHVREIERKVNTAREEFAKQIQRERPMYPDYSNTKSRPLFKIVS